MGASGCWVASLGQIVKKHWPLLLIVLLGFILRWQDLFLHAVDWDEAHTLAISKLSLHDMVWFTFTHDFHPPGFHLTLAGWTRLFGDTDGSLRGFSMFWGLLAVMAAYWLAQELGKSRALSSLTALFVALMPVAIRYSHFSTSAPVHFALVLFSWIFFLKLWNTPAETSAWKTSWCWLYAITAFWATQQYASGPFFLLFQGLYFCWRFRELPRSRQFLLLGIGLFILLASVPHLVVIMQPWHVAQSPLIKILHPSPSFNFFFFSPLSLLFYNYDLRTSGNDLSLVPPVEVLAPLSFFLYLLLGYGFQQIKRWNEAAFWQLLLIGVFPLLTAYLLSFAGFSFFNFRSLLYTAFPFCFALAFLIQTLWTQKRLIASAVLLGLLAMQLSLAAPLKSFSSIDWRILAKNLKAEARPGDGIIVYPGFMALPLIRYYNPTDFGYSEWVLRVDPTKGDNVFNQVDRINGKYFMVSGPEVSSRPWVQQAFQKFQTSHKRLLWVVFGPSLPLLPLLDCQRPMRIVTSEGAEALPCFLPPEAQTQKPTHLQKP